MVGIDLGSFSYNNYIELTEVFPKHWEMLNPYIKVQWSKNHNLQYFKVDVFSTLKLNVCFEK